MAFCFILSTGPLLPEDSTRKIIVFFFFFFSLRACSVGSQLLTKNWPHIVQKSPFKAKVGFQLP